MLKRKLRLLLLLLLAAFFAAGCARQAASADLRNALRDQNPTYASDGELLFSLELTETGGIFRFLEPASLQNLTITLDNETVRAAYGALETEVPQAFVGKLLPFYHALCAFRSEAPITDTRQTESEQILQLTLDETVFLLYYDTETNRILRMGQEGQTMFDIPAASPQPSSSHS